MDDRIAKLLKMLGEKPQYSLLVDRVLRSSGDTEAFIELIRRLKEHGDLISARELAASLDEGDELLKEAREVGFRHPYLTSDLAVFLRGSGIRPSGQTEEYLKGRVEEEKETARLRGMLEEARDNRIRSLTRKRDEPWRFVTLERLRTPYSRNYERIIKILNVLHFSAEYSPLIERILNNQNAIEAWEKLFQKMKANNEVEYLESLLNYFPTPRIDSRITLDDRWDVINGFISHRRAGLPAMLRYVWMKPDQVEALFSKIDRPVYEIESARRLIQDILSWARLEVINSPTDDEIQSLGERLATVSDSELCCTWFMTVGEFLLCQKDLTINEETDTWLNEEYNAALSGSGGRWKEGPTIDIEHIHALRESKKPLKERALRFEGYLEFVNTYVGEIFVEFIDLTTASVMWKHLCYEGLLPGYLLKGGPKRMPYMDEEEYRNEYAEFMRQRIYGAVEDIHAMNILVDFLPLKNLSLLIQALRVATISC